MTRRLPPHTIRLRLTLLYGALFLISGAVLLAITYLLVRNATGEIVLIQGAAAGKHSSPSAIHDLYRNSQQLPASTKQLQAQATRQHAAELHQLLVQSGIALAIMAVISIALGWLVAGRALRPMRAMTATTRRISEHNLHERLAIQGPHDELRDLADTVDGLLERLEGAFGAQRRFVANAAHELRTPLTLLRALLEETLTDPSATIDSFRATSRRLLALGEEQERLLESLFTLASSERGLDHQAPFELSAVTETVLLNSQPGAEHADVQIDVTLERARTTGDPALAERLAANLVDNAIRHNTAGGKVQVATGTKAGRPFLSVTNSGPIIPAAEIERLFEPFQRLALDRTAQNGDHHGLGLSIVRAIATAHHATITAEAQTSGGLTVEVSFPPPNAHRDEKQAYSEVIADAEHRQAASGTLH